MDRTFTVEVHNDEVTIGEENSSGVRYLLPNDGCQLDSLVKAVTDYIYTYLSGIDDNV